MPSDQATLLAAARAGDGSAFEELLLPHRAKVWSICWRIAGNQHDAEDALQEALTAAWLNLDKFRGDSSFGTWAYRIAANAALAIVRKRREVLLDDFSGLDRADGPDFTEGVVLHDAIGRALADLPEQFREALVLREYGDLSYEEIAAHQDVGVQTVKSRLNRARAALAANVERT